MQFDIQIAHTVSEIGQEAWDHLARNQPFAGYGWYHFGETVLNKDLPCYVTLWRDREPVARGTFWLTKQDPLPLPSRPARYLVQSLIRRWPLLICQSPLSSSSGLILPNEPILKKAALETIGQVAQEIAQQNKVSFLIFTYLNSQALKWNGWPAGYATATIDDPETRLVIRWDSFKAYLSHLSKKQRKNYRYRQNTAKRLGVEIKKHPKVANIDQAMQLITNVYERYTTPVDYWLRRQLEYAHMVNATWFTAEQNGKMVGCELVLNDQQTYLVRPIGLDYSVPQIYFNLGYADIEHAIEHGGRILRWGSGSQETKQHLGFELEDNNHSVFVGQHGLFHKFGRWLAANL